MSIIRPLTEKTVKVEKEKKPTFDKDSKSTIDKHGLLKEPWRCLYNKGTWTKQYAEKLFEDIQSHDVKHTDISNIRILLLGPVRAGKSSFMNTVSSIDKGRISQITVASDSSSSTTYQLKEYRPIKKLGNFSLLDSMSVEDSDQGGLNIKDVVSLVKGNIRPGYKFNPVTPIDEGNKDFMSEPDSNEEIHCVVFVCDANVIEMDTISDATRTKLNQLQNELKFIKVPRIVLLTKIDVLCEFVEKDVENAYKSPKVFEAVRKAQELYGVPRQNVFPVKNYEHEMEMDIKKDILPLLALKQMMDFGTDFQLSKTQVKSGDEKC